MASFTISPVFVVRDICDLDLNGLIGRIPDNLRAKVHKVTAGPEQDVGCSMNTKPMLIQPVQGEGFNPAELETLRKALIDLMCVKQPAE